MVPSHWVFLSAVQFEVAGGVFGPNTGHMAPEKGDPEIIKLKPFFLVNSLVQHLLWSSIQCLYSQTAVLVPTVTAQLFLPDCLPTPPP